MLPNKPRKVDLAEKVRLHACDLRPGMYICELDRPWLETPFLFQGFDVKDDADINAVMQYCEYVYIDLQRTKAVRQTGGDSTGGSLSNKKTSRLLEKDLETAEATYRHTSNLIKSFADEIRFGSSPDIHLAKAVVSECVSSILRNPGVMIFLTRLRSKDEYIYQHAFNVCVYSIVLGRLLGFDNLKLENLGTCGLLHDMGMVAIPDEILNKPGKLNDEEIAIIQSHPAEGRDILMSGRNIYDGAVDVAYGHHENLDGTGYPLGHQLNLNCKIVAVVDKYDAIISEKPYRLAGDHLAAVAILNKLSKENKIDGDLTSAFLGLLGIYPPGSIVELSTGEVGIVLESNPKQRLRPQILVVRAPNKEPIQRFINLSEKTLDDRGRPYRIASVCRPGAFGVDLGQYYNSIIKAFNS